MIELRNAFMRETDDAKKKKMAEVIQARAFEIATHVPLGEFRAPMAASRKVSGFFVSNGNLYWNLKKN
jgi:peptide/nickel transport system substrate-binding protein